MIEMKPPIDWVRLEVFNCLLKRQGERILMRPPCIFTPYQNQTKIGDATVFILPDQITGLILTKDDGTEIDASKKIKEYTFEAGKLYDLTISKGVQNNTNTRSIDMSVRCVSE